MAFSSVSLLLLLHECRLILLVSCIPLRLASRVSLFHILIRLEAGAKFAFLLSSGDALTRAERLAASYAFHHSAHSHFRSPSLRTRRRNTGIRRTSWTGVEISPRRHFPGAWPVSRAMWNAVRGEPLSSGIPRHHHFILVSRSAGRRPDKFPFTPLQ